MSFSNKVYMNKYFLNAFYFTKYFHISISLIFLRLHGKKLLLKTFTPYDLNFQALLWHDWALQGPKALTVCSPAVTHHICPTQWGRLPALLFPLSFKLASPAWSLMFLSNLIGFASLPTYQITQTSQSCPTMGT